MLPQVPIATKQITKPGCVPLDPRINCVWYNNRCDTKTNQPCRGTQICCPNECGTSCRIPIRQSPIKCPPINKGIVCVWFNEQCNYTDKLCPLGSICCKDNCGSFCVGPMGRVGPVGSNI